MGLKLEFRTGKNGVGVAAWNRRAVVSRNPSISLTIIPFLLHSIFSYLYRWAIGGDCLPHPGANLTTNVCYDGLCTSDRKFYVDCFVVWPWLKSSYRHRL
jgi:hypothetical protein